MLFEPRPALIGHRGLGRGLVDGHRENTLASFLAAADLGLRWVEVDVRRTADDALVVHHHPTTADGAWVVELAGQDAVRRGLLPLPALLEALPPEVGVMFDVKSSLEDALEPTDRGTTALLLAAATAEARRRTVVVASFDPAVLLAASPLVRSGVALALTTWLYFPLRKAVPAARHLGVQAVAAHWKSFGPNEVDPAPVHRSPGYVVDVAHRAGLAVVAWCPPVDAAGALADAGVDALVVDDVPTTVSALAC